MGVGGGSGEGGREEGEDGKGKGEGGREEGEDGKGEGERGFCLCSFYQPELPSCLHPCRSQGPPPLHAL